MPETKQYRLAVLGAGSWGATVAGLLAGNGHAVKVWSFTEDGAADLRAKRHPPGVPELRLPESVVITSNLEEAVADTDAAALVVPAQAMRGLCAKLAKIRNRPRLLVLASKGIDLEKLCPLSTVVEEEVPECRVAVMSGPCIAREVAQGVPTSVVVACEDDESCRRVQTGFANRTFRVYRQHDVLGVEYGGALKNVIAIAAGVGDGLGFGANSKAALLTRGLAEMQRFALAHGAQEQTIAGLAGLGDLAVTCFSPHSRNRRMGEALGKGVPADEATRAIGEVVEGIPTARAVVRLASAKGIEVPVAVSVVKIVDGEWSPREAVERLMTRELKPEF